MRDIGVDDLLNPFSAYVSGVDRINVLDADRMVTILLHPVHDLSPGGIGEGRHVLTKLAALRAGLPKRRRVLVVKRHAFLNVVILEAF
jgi:hypothetical protein